MTSSLDRASAMPVADYNPAVVITAVNALQRLGKEKALEQIDSFWSNHHNRTYPSGLLWVLRVLFDVREDVGFPPVVIGTPDIPPPVDPVKLPRFPIVIVRDIPFLVVRGFVLFGVPESLEPHIAYFRSHGLVRAKPLEPADCSNGIDEAFLQLWQSAYGNTHAAHALETIKEQCARLAITSG